METFSALLALCAGDSPVTVEFPAQKPLTRSFDFFFGLRLSNGWVNNREADDLRRHSAHYDVTVMLFSPPHNRAQQNCVYISWDIQWNLSVTTTSVIKFITCDLFSNVF